MVWGNNVAVLSLEFSSFSHEKGLSKISLLCSNQWIQDSHCAFFPLIYFSLIASLFSPVGVLPRLIPPRSWGSSNKGTLENHFADLPSRAGWSYGSGLSDSRSRRVRPFSAIFWSRSLSVGVVQPFWVALAILLQILINGTLTRPPQTCFPAMFDLFSDFPANLC